MIRPVPPAVLLAILPAAALAQPSPADFARLDRDKSGTLVREELPEGPRRNFDRIDADRDGSISRAEFGRLIEQLHRAGQGGPRQPEGVTTKRDIPYAGTDNPRQRLDLYLPKEPKSKALPVVVFIHGGGWQGGDRAGGLGRVSRFVASGECAGASIGYRLSGEATWPAQIHDVKAAIRWLRANASAHGLDADRIAVWGTSAGGHLVAMLGTTGDVPELEGDLGPHAGVSSEVAAVVNFYGPTDMFHMGDEPGRLDIDSPGSPVGKLLGGPVREKREAARQASPVTHASKADAPTLTVHGTRDTTVPFSQGERLHKALTEAGVPSVLVPVEGAGHGDVRGPEIDRRVEAFLAKHLLGKDVEVSSEPIERAP